MIGLMHLIESTYVLVYVTCKELASFVDFREAKIHQCRHFVAGTPCEIVINRNRRVENPIEKQLDVMVANQKEKENLS